MLNKIFPFVAGTLLASAAVAQTPPAAPAAPAASQAPAAGATVYDAQGGVVGTIASTDGTNAVVDTGSVKAAVPLTSFGTSPKGPTLGLTKEQLEAAAGQQAASPDFKAKLVAGTTVYDSAGEELGTIKAADAEFITLATASGEARLPVSAFGPGPKGVAIGMTKAQLDAAISGAAPKK
ncbi:MAG: hypothetical protein QM688_00920 [Sphingomonas bacterium]